MRNSDLLKGIGGLEDTRPVFGGIGKAELSLC